MASFFSLAELCKTLKRFHTKRAIFAEANEAFKSKLRRAEVKLMQEKNIS